MTKQELLNHLIDSGEYQKDYYMCNALHFSKVGTKKLRKELQQEIAELIYPYGTLVVALWHKNPYICELLNTDPYLIPKKRLAPFTTYIYRNWDKRHQLINGGNHVSRT